MTEPTQPAQEAGEPMITEQPGGERRPRLGVRLFGLALVIISVTLATYLVVAWFAFESGREAAVIQASTSRAEQIDRQIELAREDLAEGSVNLARTRLEWVLTQDPANGVAPSLLDEITAGQTTPTPEPTEEPAPDVTDEPPAADATEAQPELQTIHRMIAARQWESALPALLAFRLQFPDYQRNDTDKMLYDTYVALGLKHVNSDKIEMGLNYFSQAERLGNLPQEALDYRVWADLYFQGVAYSGVNWQIASGYWRDLCAAAPFFKNACERFDAALEGYGDQLAYLEDWCPAVPIYQEAWNRNPTEKLQSKLSLAREGCAAATPVPITGTLPLTGTAPITDTAPSPGEPGG